MNGAALLDVNFLLALAWPHHQFHPLAQRWFSQNQSKGWATCTVTQLGFIRLSSNPSYLRGEERTPEEARLLLRGLIDHPHHRFLPDRKSPVELSEMSAVLGHQQVTDAYLVGTARLSGFRLVTFDRQLVALGGSRGLIEVLKAEI
jgi:toxin-antitoxin system PIN domain toxin